MVLLLLSPPRQARGLDKAHVRNAAHQCVLDASMALLVTQHPCCHRARDTTTEILSPEEDTDRRLAPPPRDRKMRSLPLQARPTLRTPLARMLSESTEHHGQPSAVLPSSLACGTSSRHVGDPFLESVRKQLLEVLDAVNNSLFSPRLRFVLPRGERPPNNLSDRGPPLRPRCQRASYSAAPCRPPGAQRSPSRPAAPGTGACHQARE